MKKNYLFKKNTARLLALSTAFISLSACSPRAEENPYQPMYSQGYTTLGVTTSSASNACYATSSASACSSGSSYSYYSSKNYYGMDEDFNTEEYSALDENVFKEVAVSPLSTFSADVDTASYSNVRRLINHNTDPSKLPQGSIRIEEMINYFSYDYSGPKDDYPFGVNAEISTCPWNEEHELVQIGIQTEEMKYSKAPDSNLVLLIDVSGSMYSPEKLPLLIESFSLMLNNLSSKDRISIVTYAGGSDIILDGEKASHKKVIKDALEGLQAGGSTNGAQGIIDAYKLAEKNFIEGGNNRVIIASDGDFNVGASSESELKTLISEKAQSGVFLTVLGFGMGNYSDSRMEILADKGNGNYAYIDTIAEAKKVLVDEFCANMVTVAKDVKFQVEFNPCYVSEYRLLGYENRALNNEDFKDDKKDAGEIGSGHSVTVLYEIVPASGSSEDSSNLKYQTSTLTKEALESDEWLTLSIRYKEPDEDNSKLLNYTIGGDRYKKNPSDDFRFCAAVAEYAMVLRNSEYLADGSMEHVSKTLKSIRLNDDFKKEFKELVEKCNSF